MFLPSQKLYRLLILLLMPNMLSALPDDRQQPIKIDSDKFVQKTLKSGGEKIEYIGNVLVVQGTLQITGERVTVFRKDSSITKIVATGNPAQFQQQPTLDKDPIRALANNIQYILKNDALLLAGNAKIFQQGSVISSDKINYNIAAESVAASSSDSESSRVKMVLEPGGAEIPKNSYEKELGTKPDQNITNPAAEEQ
ncbi:MAG: lipopolysaccharide export system protein LptA [Oceanicoccus sp.]|jgi:lipopolysaccharide export system protein LptA